MREALYTTARLAAFDITRLLRKRSTILVILLFVLPIATAVLVRAWGPETRSNPELWAFMLGVSLAQGAGGGPVMGLVGVNLFSWWWLIVALYAGDVIARDIEEGTLYLVLSRPVTRGQVLAAKAISTTALLALYAVIGAYSVYGAAWIIAGAQENAWGPLVSGLALAVGSLPLIAVGFIIGLLTRKSTTSIIVVVAVYFVASIIVGILGFAALIARGQGNFMETGLLFSALIPLDGGKHFAALTYTRLAEGPVVAPLEGFTETITIGGKTVTLTAGPINVGRLLNIAIVSLAAWAAGLLGLAYLLFRNRDF